MISEDVADRRAAASILRTGHYTQNVPFDYAERATIRTRSAVIPTVLAGHSTCRN